MLWKKQKEKGEFLLTEESHAVKPLNQPHQQQEIISRQAKDGLTTILISHVFSFDSTC